MEKACEQCGALFQKKPRHSVAAWALVRFFGKPCYTDFQKGKDYLEGNRYSGDVWNKGKKLGKSPRNTKVEITCSNCKSQFHIKRHQLGTAKFCSRKCMYQSRDFGLSSVNDKIRSSGPYLRWRKAVYVRDDYTCQICRQRGGRLNADHIKAFAYYHELRFELNNGRTLCEPCHKETDNYAHRAKPRSVTNPVTAVAQEA